MPSSFLFVTVCILYKFELFKIDSNNFQNKKKLLIQANI